MSETKRTLAEVHQEYANICSKYGNLVYQSNVFRCDAELLFEQLKELNFEAARIQSDTKKEEAKS